MVESVLRLNPLTYTNFEKTYTKFEKTTSQQEPSERHTPTNTHHSAKLWCISGATHPVV